jgi:glucose-1-phosphate thymidylyltransferase
MHIIVFEDNHVERLHPIAIGRPAYGITCASYRLVDWLARLGDSRRAVTRTHLREIQRVDYPQFDGGRSGGDSPTLLVNARVVPSVSSFKTLQRLAKEGRPGVVHSNAQLAAAVLPTGLTPPSPNSVEELHTFLASDRVAALPPIEAALPLFEYPHDVVRWNMAAFRENLDHRLAEGSYREIADNVFVAAGAQIGEYAVYNTKSGPIVVDEAANIGPFAYLAGPVYIGPRARVNEHAAVKDAVSLGHTTKIGGEVEASVVEPYTNKQHHGFLGHSYLGSWINLGAGTCNSDLKNTYGEVNMTYGDERVSTNMQFFGCVMGDYAKTAINTGIFTGKSIGACSMLYGFVTTNVPSYVNYARLFGQVTELPPEVMVATQRRMFARRKVEQRPCDIQLILDMYELTRAERQLAGEPMSL